jgi:hypothetical protein
MDSVFDIRKNKIYAIDYFVEKLSFPILFQEILEDPNNSIYFISME